MKYKNNMDVSSENQLHTLLAQAFRDGYYLGINDASQGIFIDFNALANEYLGKIKIKESTLSFTSNYKHTNSI